MYNNKLDSNMFAAYDDDLLLLFSCYNDNLFSQLQHSGLGCHVGLSYAGAFGYAGDIALLAPS